MKICGVCELRLARNSLPLAMAIEVSSLLSTGRSRSTVTGAKPKGTLGLQVTRENAPRQREL